jgi:hypothetical protein
MSIESSTDESKSLTVFTGKGQVTYEEVKAAIESFYDGDHTENVLWNLEKASIDRITPVQVKQLVSFLKQYTGARKGVRTAIVSSLDMTFGLARMLVSMLEVKEQGISIYMNVFRTIDEAHHWLFDSE